MASHKRATVLLAIYLSVVATAAFWPSPIDAPLSGQLAAGLTKLHRLGVPEWFNYAAVELLANVALFVPWGALLASLLTKNIWITTALSGFGASSLIELGQFLLLTERFASWQDVSANTFGAVLGAAVVVTIQSQRAPELRNNEAPPD